MEEACNVAVAMFADLVERFQKSAAVPLVVAGSQDASIEDYAALLASQGVRPNGIEFCIAEAEERTARVMRVWEILTEEFERVIQCTLDIPYFTPNQCQRLIRGLDRCDIAFHPTLDDGMCPYGLKKPFDLWTNIESRDSGALGRILQRFQDNNLVWWCGEPLFDIDTIEDLCALDRWMHCLSPEDESYCARTAKLCRSIL
jgi:glycosyltransferase A (GT-A) superfamily protein (DUF2064 family)